jgi:hypothetical protein
MADILTHLVELLEHEHKSQELSTITVLLSIECRVVLVEANRSLREDLHSVRLRSLSSKLTSIAIQAWPSNARSQGDSG